jgi:hypothetical protein
VGPVWSRADTLGAKLVRDPGQRVLRAIAGALAAVLCAQEISTPSHCAGKAAAAAGYGTFRRSAGWPVTAAMRSKSLSQCRTVSPASSAVAATSRSGIEGARC